MPGRRGSAFVPVKQRLSAVDGSTGQSLLTPRGCKGNQGGGRRSVGGDTFGQEPLPKEGARMVEDAENHAVMGDVEHLRLSMQAIRRKFGHQRVAAVLARSRPPDGAAQGTGITITEDTTLWEWLVARQKELEVADQALAEKVWEIRQAADCARALPPPPRHQVSITCAKTVDILLADPTVEKRSGVMRQAAVARGRASVIDMYENDDFEEEDQVVMNRVLAVQSRLRTAAVDLDSHLTKVRFIGLRSQSYESARRLLAEAGHLELASFSTFLATANFMEQELRASSAKTCPDDAAVPRMEGALTAVLALPCRRVLVGDGAMHAATELGVAVDDCHNAWSDAVHRSPPPWRAAFMSVLRVLNRVRGGSATTRMIGQAAALMDVKITVVRAKGLMLEESECSPYCVAQVSNDATTRQTSQTVRDSEDPEWDLQLECKHFKAWDDVVFLVLHENSFGGHFLGKTALYGPQVLAGFNGWLPLHGVAEEASIEVHTQVISEQQSQH